MAKRFLFIGLSFFSATLSAQIKEVDSVLTIDMFIQWVDQNHPLLKAVGNKLPIAKAELRKARGAFDPYISGTLASKEFNGEQYYRRPGVQLSSVTASPVQLQLDWNSIDGLYTNPQDKLPPEGLFAVGGMINLGKGLLTDVRRTDLALAKAGVELSAAEAELYRNELLTKAAQSYWKWFEADQNAHAYEVAWQAAMEVYAFTINAFEAGDASAMDTLDARALVSTWETDFYSAQSKAVKALYDLSNWLWSAEERPVVLQPYVRPSAELPQQMETTLLGKEHPLWTYNDQKEEQLRLKRQLAREYLKPTIAVGGAYLLPGNFEALPSQEDFDANNRLVKAKLGIPLFLREGRGYTQSQNLQLESFQWERSAVENQWNNALSSTATQLLQLESAVKASVANQESVLLLLQAEQKKLVLGDSELIKVNLRTSYFAKAQIQRAKLQAELGQTWAYWMQLSAAY
ncbi:MAG: TolC family protein [Flavobacteriia bacterium]|nr:TolC family protein [Flavobacteriia bacterium]